MYTLLVGIKTIFKKKLNFLWKKQYKFGYTDENNN